MTDDINQHDDFEIKDNEIDKPEKGTNQVIIKVRNEVFFGVLILVVFILGLFSGYIWRGQDNDALTSNLVAAIGNPGGNPGSTAEQAEERPPTRYDVPEDGNPAFGAEDAPITIIEFSDYECPYCSKWHNEVYSQLIEEYGDQIRFVYRDLPLTSIHPEAFPAAEAANCAGEQGEYWAYQDSLFTGGADILGQDTYRAYAVDLELDMESFEQCLEEHRYRDEIQADYDYAINLGIRSTPTFFVNGLALVGAQSFESFQQLIENELAAQQE
ncbi:MAG: DsbA family protein [Chloroflexota bacterium]